jgi:hypothetical protein
MAPILLANVDLPDPGYGTPLSKYKYFEGGVVFWFELIYLLLELFLILNINLIKKNYYDKLY